MTGTAPTSSGAWPLLSNHGHLLIGIGARPLSRAMRSLLAGYTGAFMAICILVVTSGALFFLLTRLDRRTAGPITELRT
jgi:hypothetical protein